MEIDVEQIGKKLKLELKLSDTDKTMHSVFQGKTVHNEMLMFMNQGDKMK